MLFLSTFVVPYANLFGSPFADETMEDMLMMEPDLRDIIWNERNQLLTMLHLHAYVTFE